MPKEFSRSRRVEEQLKRLLAELVRREIKDPRVGLVTITAVEVSRDLTHARVFFTPFAGQGDAQVIDFLHAAHRPIYSVIIAPGDPRRPPVKVSA